MTKTERPFRSATFFGLIGSLALAPVVFARFFEKLFYRSSFT
jgi:hypothetical protein